MSSPKPPAWLGTRPTLRRYDAKLSADVAQLVEHLHGKEGVRPERRTPPQHRKSSIQAGF